VTCTRCGKASLEGGLCPPCLDTESPLGRVRNQRTFLELRQALGFGPRRLKLLLWLREHPELDYGAWKFEGSIGGGESVKMGLWQMMEVQVSS
jgi:hypothetical protein